jgi:DNA recombination protein RmuC
MHLQMHLAIATSITHKEDMMQLEVLVPIILGLVVLLIVGTIVMFVLLLKQKQTGVDADEIKNKISYDIVKNQSEINLSSTNQINKNLNEQVDRIRTNLEERLDKSTKQNVQELSNVLDKLAHIQKDFTESRIGLVQSVNEQLEKINASVEQRLKDGFKTTTDTFQSVTERLAEIKEAQRKIESLSTDIVSLQDVLTDKKTRGNFGEVQLKQILYTVFGEVEGKLYETQKKLSNGSIVDAIIHLPDTNGSVPIDSKFPLENYRRMLDKELSEKERDDAKKLFKTDVRKHIDDISKKYILEDETSFQAILFLPAEAVFSEINAYHADIIDYAQNKKVILTSPTTLMALLRVLQVLIRDAQKTKYAKLIFEELDKLGKDFKLYTDRWSSLEKSIDKVVKDAKDINVSSKKISTQFEKIKNAQFDEELEVGGQDES